MAAVSNCSPLRYLIAIGQADLLPEIFGSIAVPDAVVRELSHSSAPKVIREWVKNPPGWLLTHALTVPVEASLTEILDDGESEAIQLALELKSEFILIDERRGRQEATNRGLKPIGALGVLLEAKRLEVITDPMRQLAELRAQGFRVSKRLAEEFRRLASGA